MRPFWDPCAGCSDAFAVNLAAVTLRFARPFVGGFWSKSPKFADLMPKHLSPAYYATQPHRLQSLGAVSSLAGEVALLGSASKEASRALLQ